jgi:hypothetical protein
MQINILICFNGYLEHISIERDLQTKIINNINANNLLSVFDS